MSISTINFIPSVSKPGLPSALSHSKIALQELKIALVSMKNAYAAGAISGTAVAKHLELQGLLEQHILHVESKAREWSSFMPVRA